jgi:hypothetical protein
VSSSECHHQSVIILPSHSINAIVLTSHIYSH